MEPFIPPGFSLPLAWGIDFSLPLLLRMVQNLEGVEIRPEDQKMLRDLRKERNADLSTYSHSMTDSLASTEYQCNSTCSCSHL